MTREPKDWQCQECGKRMTMRQAVRATERGCACGGHDIDLADVVESEPRVGVCRHCGHATDAGIGLDWEDAHRTCSREDRRRTEAHLARGGS